MNEIKNVIIKKQSDLHWELKFDLTGSRKSTTYRKNLNFDNDDEAIIVLSRLEEFHEYFKSWTTKIDEKLSVELKKGEKKTYLEYHFASWEGSEVSIFALEQYLLETKRPSKMERIVNELCEVGEITDFRKTVFKGVHEVMSHGKTIRIITASGDAVEDIEPSHDSNGIINLPVNKMEKGADFLWTTFHEFGHACDPAPLTEKSLKREQFAWDKARDLLKEVLADADLNEKFNARMNYCLNQYKAHFEKQKRN